MSFQATVRHTDDIAVIDLEGRLTLGDASIALRNTIVELIAQGERKILLNLTDLSYLDSAGMGEMCAAYTSVTNVGGEVKLICTDGKIHDQMEVTKLSTVIADYPDEDTAARSFRREPTKVSR